MLESGKCYRWKFFGKTMEPPSKNFKFCRNIYNTQETMDSLPTVILGTLSEQETFLCLKQISDKIFYILKNDIVGYIVLYPDECENVEVIC